MTYWYFEKRELRETPSFHDGVSYETEQRYRKEGALFIMDCGSVMRLGHNTIATAVVFYHRFFMMQSFKEFPRYLTASCCLFLAGKVEETPKKSRDIIKVARSLLPEHYFRTFGENPREELMTLERILLQTIKFDFQVDHPYKFLIQYVKGIQGDQDILQSILQMAWNFVNDSFSTMLCVEWQPEIIAVALIYLACKLKQFQVVDWAEKTAEHRNWWDIYIVGITRDLLNDICQQILNIYQQNQIDADNAYVVQQEPSAQNAGLGTENILPNGANAAGTIINCIIHPTGYVLPPLPLQPPPPPPAQVMLPPLPADIPPPLPQHSTAAAHGAAQIPDYANYDIPLPPYAAAQAQDAGGTVNSMNSINQMNMPQMQSQLNTMTYGVPSSHMLVPIMPDFTYGNLMPQFGTYPLYFDPTAIYVFPGAYGDH